MNAPNTDELLKIRLTTPPPHWAVETLAQLKQQPNLQFFEVNDPVDNSLIDIVLHFGSYSKAFYQQCGAGRLGFWFFGLADRAWIQLLRHAVLRRRAWLLKAVYGQKWLMKAVFVCIKVLDN